jgi:hypothetical protein
MEGRAWKGEHGRESMKGRTGQAELDRQDRTGRKGKAEQNRQKRTGRQDPGRQDPGRTGLPELIDRIKLPGQDGLDGSARPGLIG